ncbi:hypothetical protein [uncultured Roseobacter sp.]|uniref:hypothetical protein n=1 Tax=uncultured Roseobacter sp. TaxID=114847 RepID=UPI00260B455A|nr:hypothetical protein [uncultured Roseobacter sp.]
MSNEPTSSNEVVGFFIRIATDLADGILGTMLTANYLWGVVTSLVVVWARHRVTLPKPRHTGGGSERRRLDDKVVAEIGYMTITNAPKVLGYPINRDTLRARRVSVYDPKIKKKVGSAIWSHRGKKPSLYMEIEAGQSQALLVYTTQNGEVKTYQGDTLKDIQMAQQLVEPNSSRLLEVHIEDVIGRKFRVPFKMIARDAPDMLVGVSAEAMPISTLKDRVRRVRRRLRKIRRAI